MILLNKQDSDEIKVKEYIQNGFSYNLICNSTNNLILINTNYLENNYFDLNTTIDSNKALDKGTYYINCYFKNRFNIYNITPITLKYFDENITSKSINKIDNNSNQDLNIPRNKKIHNYFISKIIN